MEGKLPVGSVLHPDLSFDAERVLFSFCDHTPSDPNLRRFFIYEIGIDGSGLRQLTGTADDPLAGADGRQTALIEDFDPCYLPDGGFAFVSTRLQTHVRCQYGGRYFANFVLYRADGDGSNIRRLSFGEAPEWEPSVLDDGRHRLHAMGLRQPPRHVLPEPVGDAARRHGHGPRLRQLHEKPLHDRRAEGRFPARTRSSPRPWPITATRPARSSWSIPDQGQDGQAPITRITPEIAFPETEGWPDRAPTANPYPLSEDLFLVAYTPDPLVRRGKRAAARTPTASI